MKQKGIFFIVVLACALWFFGYANQASASSSYYTDPTKGVSGMSCADCHGGTSTCNGCHAHGTHPDSSKSSLNITATTDKTSYQAGEAISVTITGGYRTGWVRVILYNGDPTGGGVELARSTGPNGTGGGPGYPITLKGQAPTAPGTYTFSASWYGNKYDKSGGFFGAKWRPDPNNPNHGEEIVATNSFTVTSNTPPPAPAISVTDSVAPATDLSVPFGSVNTGSSANQTVTITNTGTANLAVGAVGSTNALAAPFSISNDTCSNQTIAPSASCTMRVTFAPTATGTLSDSFNIPSNDPAKSSVIMNVSGTGAAVPTPAISVTDSVAPTTDLSVPFGSVNTGSSVSQTVTITNTGTANLAVGAIGSANPLAAPFSIKTDTCSNQAIAPAASCTVTIAFTPTATGTLSDSFSIPSSDPSKATVTVNVSGTGAAVPTPAISVTDSVAPTTDLQVPFGTVIVSSSASQTVTVKNTGTANLVMGAVGSANPLAAPFTITADTCSNQTIAPAATCTLTIAFAPTSTGTLSDSFSIPSNDPSKATVTVNVNGAGGTVPVPGITVTDSVAPTNDLLVPYGTVSAGSSATKTVTITNSGNAALVIGAVGSTDSLAAPFTMANDTCSNQTIAPAATCTLTIAFAPTLTGTFTDSFNIPSNDPNNASVTVSLSGIGASVSVGDIKVTDAVAPVDDLLVPFGNLREGRTADQIVTVTNAAEGNLVIGSVASADPLASPFSITSDNCSGKTLAAGNNCTLTIRFSPPTGCADSSGTGTSGAATPGTVKSCQYSDSFDISSNDPDEQVVTVQVSGAGVSSQGNNPPGKPRLRHPADHERDLNTELDMEWDEVSDPDGDHVNYELRISTDSNFLSPIVISKTPAPAGKMSGTLFAGTGLGFIFFGVVFAGTARGRKGLLLVAAVVILAGSTLVGCSVGSVKTPASGAVVSQHVSGLQTTTSYYWKVIASDGNGGVTESDVSTFSTK
jgi:hypothetical protein